MHQDDQPRDGTAPAAPEFPCLVADTDLTDEQRAQAADLLRRRAERDPTLRAIDHVIALWWEGQIGP
jgi:hypothetical protein